MTNLAARYGASATLAVLAMAGLAGLPSESAQAARPRPAPTPIPTSPPRQVIVIPPRPLPPVGVGDAFVVPPVDGQGVRQTINAHISAAQTTWNFRSAYNVAALNCRDVKYNPVLAGYRAFLRTHAVALRSANAAVDAGFRSRYGGRAVAPREAYMTQVYNFYSFPPTLTQFCDASLEMSATGAKVTRPQLASFAAAQLPKLDMVFENFYRSFEQYRRDAAAWDVQWGPYLKSAVPAAPAAPKP